MDENFIDLMAEERGVAVNSYNGAINDIYKYVQNYMDDNKPKEGTYSLNDKVVIEIPRMLLSKIDFINEKRFFVYVIVHIIDYNTGGNDELYDFGSAETAIEKHAYLTSMDNKLSGARIQINANANKDGKIYKKTFFNNAYHELNHDYEIYSQLKDNSNADGDTIKMSTSDTSNKIENLDEQIAYYLNSLLHMDKPIAKEVGKEVRYMIYRLHSDTEMNALIASVYADLKSMDSDRKNANEDIKKTFAYIHYEYFKKQVEGFSQITNDDALSIIWGVLNSRNIHISNTPDSFKDKFISIFNKKLKHLYKGIIRTASLWYDNKEDKLDSLDESNKKLKCGNKKTKNTIIHYDDNNFLSENKINNPWIINKLNNNYK